jgi:pimeloyl-ACP methyl ester carboxylesterase
MEVSGGAQQFAHERWPYEPRFKQVNDWRIHYVDEGVGDPVVLLHGNPAWGFLYRRFVKLTYGRTITCPRRHASAIGAWMATLFRPPYCWKIASNLGWKTA